MATQIEFLFASLDFPGRTALTIDEIAARLGTSTQHIIDLIDEGAFSAFIDLSGVQNKTARRLIRIPIEVYRNFIVKRISGTGREELLRHLPRETLMELWRELSKIIQAA